MKPLVQAILEGGPGNDGHLPEPLQDPPAQHVHGQLHVPDGHFRPQEGRRGFNRKSRAGALEGAVGVAAPEGWL